MGLAKVIREAYPDHYSWNKEHKYYDLKSAPDNPRWFMVDIKAIKKLKRIVYLKEIKQEPKLSKMILLNNSRLSIQPVKKSEWDLIIKMSNN